MDHDARRREDSGSARPPTQIHEPGALPVDEAVPARHPYWELLPEDVRDRLLEKAGRVLTWWAGPDTDGRPSAVVLGDTGLCRVAQVVARDGSAEFRGQRIRLEPGSLRARSFDGRPAPDGRTAAPGPPGAPVRRLELGSPAQSVLGHLPLPVQDFLQRPFLGGDARVTADWYYDRTDEPGLTTWFLALVLHTEHTLTAVEGTRTLAPGERADQARWLGIQCHQARLVPR